VASALVGAGGRRDPSAGAVVGGILAVQAEQHRHALWGLACRSETAAGEAPLAREFDAGRFLRTHVPSSATSDGTDR
jgi:hypothetical protein